MKHRDATGLAETVQLVHLSLPKFSLPVPVFDCSNDKRSLFGCERSPALGENTCILKYLHLFGILMETRCLGEKIPGSFGIGHASIPCLLQAMEQKAMPV
jgi:hypothetical protein